MCECVEVKVFTPRAEHTENSAITYQMDSLGLAAVSQEIFSTPIVW